jgi:hypothetical protein
LRDPFAMLMSRFTKSLIPIVGLAIRLTTRIVASYIAGVVGVIGYTRVLRAIPVLLIA